MPTLQPSPMFRRTLGASLALGTLAAVPAVVGAQTEATTTAACAAGGMLLRGAARARVAPSDSVVARERQLIELQRTTDAMSRSRVAAGERLRIALVRGWLGVRTSEVSDTRVTPDGWFVRYCDYPVVVSVEPASPAQKAGIESGDTIVAYNEIDLRKATEIALDKLLVPGDTVRVSVRRDGRPLVMPLVVGKRPEATITRILTPQGATGYGFVMVSPNGSSSSVVTLPRPTESPASADARRRVSRQAQELAAAVGPGAPLPPIAFTPFPLGFGYGAAAPLAGAQIVSMDEGLREVVGAQSGVLVLRVADASPASESGLRSGDVIVVADGRAVASPVVLQQLLARAAAADDHSVQLKVQRRGRTRVVTLRW